VAPGEAEVDLHIDMLSERPGDLTPHEAFEIQMHYFRLCMNHAFANKMKKVTFIHGVGKGILKDEIYKELKQYDNIHFFDAPMSKYGVGATEVYFR
jgi:DNA-nicking Smr family endonuclease